MINSSKVMACIKKELEQVKTSEFVMEFISRCQKLGYKIDTISIPYPYGIDTVSIDYEEEKNNVVVVVEDAYQFYQQNFGMLPPAIGEDIAYWIDDLSEELVIQAMKEALEQNKRTWKYVKAILRDWAQKGVKSLDDVRALETEWKNRKGGRQHATNQPSTPTPSETESDVREAIERRKRIVQSTLHSEDNSPF
jgi:DnaD/phage-associated family protein